MGDVSLKGVTVLTDPADKACGGKVCNAMCCTINLLRLDYPGCLGIRIKGLAICIETEQEVCIPVFVKEVDARGLDKSKHKILIHRGQTTCVVPPILNGGALCKMNEQTCCFETRMALPCDGEVPCMFGFCYIICFQNYKFDLQIFKTPAPGSSLGAPTSDEMAR